MTQEIIPSFHFIEAELAQLKKENAVLRELIAERKENVSLRNQLYPAEDSVKTRDDSVQGHAVGTDVWKENQKVCVEVDLNLPMGRPFEFALLPAELQKMIVMKADFLSFNTLKKSSKSVRSLCESCEEGGFRPKLQIVANDLEYDHYGDMNMNKVKFSWAICRDGDWTVKSALSSDMKNSDPCKLSLDIFTADSINGFDCPENLVIRQLVIDDIDDVEVFGQFLQQHEVRVLEAQIQLDSEHDWANFIRHPAVKQLSSLTVQEGPANLESYNREDLLALRAATIKLRRMKKSAIRGLLKTWIFERKHIVCVKFAEVVDLAQNFEQMVSGVKDEILFGLDATEQTTDNNRFQCKISRAGDVLVVEFRLVSCSWSNLKKVSFEAYPESNPPCDDSF